MATAIQFALSLPMQRLAFILMLFFVFCAGRVLACTCMVNGTVDQEFAKAANVVILKVRSLEKTEPPPPRLVNYGGIKQTTLTVEKVYKGTLKVGQELIFAQGGGADCIWTFTEGSIGQEYLFYLGSKPLDSKSTEGMISGTGQFPRVVPKDVWVATICSRSNFLKWAAADVLYLDNVEKASGRTRLSGRLTKNVESAVEGQASASEILADREVTISGNGKTIKLKTDKSGVYEIYDLPSGKYRVRPEPVEGYKFGWPQRLDDVEVEIMPKSHTEANFGFEIDSAIRGKFFDANGKPLKDVCMELLPARGTKAQYFHKFDCTEKDGSFELTEIPAGSYVLLFNDDDEVTADAPFRAFYYPKAARREQASEIQIGPGTKLENLVVVAPETAEIITVSGVLKMQDGKTAGKDIIEWASAEFMADGDKKATEYNPSSRANIDPDGRFTLRILKGQKGRLYGTVSAYPGKYVNCPKLEKLIPKKEGINIVDIKTSQVFITADVDKIGVELVFPFPNCKQAKRD